MKPRIVYLKPGELLDVRFVAAHDERKAADWNAKTHPQRILMGFPDETMIEVADPSIELRRRYPGNFVPDERIFD